MSKSEIRLTESYKDRSKEGPDYGVDIIAEETLLDRMGEKQVRRYVVQCKHYAHSKKVVGLSHVTDILDTLIHYKASGYLLVVSTDITSSLRERILKIRESQPTYSFQVWDYKTLEQRLNNYPVLVSKYFPLRFRQVKIAIPEPKGRKEAYVRDRILSHQDEFVGSKFIPKLYVRRDVEESLLNNLLPPLYKLKTLKSKYDEIIKSYLSEINALLKFPQYLFSREDSSTILTWSLDLDEIYGRLRESEQALLSNKWNPVKDYSTGGAQALFSRFNYLVQALKKYVDVVESSLSPFNDAVQNIEKAENGVKKFVHDYTESGRVSFEEDLRIKAVSTYEKKHKRLKQSISPRKFNQFINNKVDELLQSSTVKRTITAKIRQLKSSIPSSEFEQRYSWRKNEFLRRHHLQRTDLNPTISATTFSSFKQQLENISKAVRRTPLLQLQDELNSALTSLQLVVDTAGSGKTNLCCRLALQLVNKAYVVFVTGKSLGKEFSDIISYLEKEIKNAIHVHEDLKIDGLCQLLQEMEYPLIIIFDGINETANLAKMRANLSSLHELIRTTPARAIITSRVEYWNLYSDLFPDERYTKVINGRLAKFTEDEHAIAIPVYLDHYKLDIRLESKAWEQLKRPLVLRFFCEAYGNPRRRSYRHIPPIREVRLIQLFGEYCRVKYSNICGRLNEEGIPVTAKQVEDIAHNIAASCLTHKNRALNAKQLLKFLAKQGLYSPQIYRALLDEDIVIEETVELRNNELVRLVSFVYEAFMEYLMAQVLIRSTANRDTALYKRVRTLLDQEYEFVHVRGILAFLLPYCVAGNPKTCQLIFLQLRRPEYAENCVPVLLNLWDSDWEAGIWPVLQVASDNLLSVPIEQVAAFIKEWVAEHRPDGFLNSVQQNPRAIVSLLNSHAIRLITEMSIDDNDAKLKTLIRILENTAVSTIAEEVIYAIRRTPWCSKETMIDNEPIFSRLIKASLFLLEGNKNTSRDRRTWAVLDLLGTLGESWGVNKEDIPRSNALIQVVHNALFDELYIKKKVNDARMWWADMMGIHIGAIEEAVEEWVLDPVFLYDQMELLSLDDFEYENE